MLSQIRRISSFLFLRFNFNFYLDETKILLTSLTGSSIQKNSLTTSKKAFSIKFSMLRNSVKTLLFKVL